jgi:hypothetical protein
VGWHGQNCMPVMVITNKGPSCGQNFRVALSVSLGMPGMRRMGWLLLYLLSAGLVQGQQAGALKTDASQAALAAAASKAVPSVPELLPRLYEYARQYRAELPSLSCDESIVSQRVTKGVVREEVKLESTLRVVRTESGPDPFSEKLQFKSVDGHAVPARFKIPFLFKAVLPTRWDSLGCVRNWLLRLPGVEFG